VSQVGDLEHSRVVLVDKPDGWTSFQVVRHVRALAGRKAKVGHAGTLDPFATGLLLVLVGQATRVSSLLMELPKEYLVTAQFGAVSSTQDLTGTLTSTGGKVTAAAVETALPGFRGTVLQRVPMTSAVKKDGVRLYRLAHQGIEVETPEREVTVHELTLLEFDEVTQKAVLRARTSKGTYVRTLVHDLGAVLGSGAYAAALRRTRVGSFRVEDATAPETLTGEALRSEGGAVKNLSQALAFIPLFPVAGDDAFRAAHGGGLRDTPAGRFLVEGPEGLLGVYEGQAGAESRPLLVFSCAQGR
jgi:tRNA pseudouridine55 synthase